jgi:squalene-hopene/tetraprenyl-beta-curcumene cyclase
MTCHVGKIAFFSLSICLAATIQNNAQTTGVAISTVETSSSAVPESIRREATAAVNRAIDWLIARQNPDGYWSNIEFPALTALPLWAIVQGGSENKDAIDRATKYILSSANDNGSICREPAEKRREGGLCNYNTALAIVALNAVGNPEFVPFIQKGRTFLAGTQHFGGDIYRGGMGYDAENDKPDADLSNSYLAYEANSHDESPDVVTNYGGFAYQPGASKAGSFTTEDGEVHLRSYGSMTYAGMLSFIYAEVDKNDPRVQSAFEWSRKNWSVDENPGMGLQGLYYYYQTMAKALSVMGEDVIQRQDGSTLNWRTELINKLLSLQKIETDGTGYWVNTEGRWWEADPVLVTSYSLLALELALK